MLSLGATRNMLGDLSDADLPGIKLTVADVETRFPRVKMILRDFLLIR